MEISLRTCCFCVPLKYGLIVWGYIKLVVNVILLGLLIHMMQITGPMPLYYVGTAILVVLTAFTTTYVYAAHKKHFQLLRVYYYFSITENVLGVLLVVALVVLNGAISGTELADNVMVYTIPLIVLVSAGVAIQTYFIILLNNAVVKIDDRDREYYKYLSDTYEDEDM